jgi:transketolase
MTKYELKGKKPTRLGFGEALAELGETMSELVVIGTDVTGSVLTSLFRDKFPERFVSVGVAEQNATTVAAGLALSGKVAVISSYSAFAAFRNADMIRVSVCYNNVNVKIGGGHSGITVGPDGATHQSLEEVSFLRALPNMTVVVPCDYNEAKKATKAICTLQGPAFLRFGRSPVPLFTDENKEFVLGKADILNAGNDIAIIACGLMVWEALLAAEELEKNHNIKARVINLHTIKPIDIETITDAAIECGCIVTAEEHQVFGGMGSAVAEVTSKNFPVPIEFVGMKDSFGGSGDPDELLKIFGMTWKEIYASALIALKRKKNGFTGYRNIVDIASLDEDKNS